MNSKLLPNESHSLYKAIRHWSATWTCMIAIGSLIGCASQPPATLATQPVPASTRESQPVRGVVETALAQLDKPYRYGGQSPRGFDCSGLVYYAYQHSGIHIPRTSHEQLRQARRVPMKTLAPGDLLFFRETRKVTHVGLYVGDGRFIHASTGRGMVKLSSLEDPYWQEHLIGAGRYID